MPPPSVPPPVPPPVSQRARFLYNRGVALAIKILLLAITGCGVVLYAASNFWALALAIGAPVALLIYREHGDVGAVLKKRMVPFFRTITVPAIGFVAAFVVGAIIMLITGDNPLLAYGALFYGGFVKNWAISLLNAVPLIFTGLAIAFAFRAGLFNIGAEGQYYVGAMAAAVIGIYLDIPAIFAIPLIFIAGGLAAAAYNVIPTLLKVKTGAHEVITTMMFAHIARLLSPLVIRNFGGHITSKHPLVTYEIVEQARLPLFQDILPNAYYRLHSGLLIAIGVAILVHWVIEHTKIGFEIRAVGHNRRAARAQGISVGKVFAIALLGSGLLAGLSGVVEVLGLNHRLFENLDAGYGWNGISVALLAGNNPIAIIFTAILWGALDAGGQYMQRNVQTPNSIIEIIKGIVLFLLVAKYLYTVIYHKMRRPKASAHDTREK